MSTLSKNIVWIASYPRSGNTWIRFLLYNLIFGKQDSCVNLNNFIPDIHDQPETARCTPNGHVLFKTHFKLSPSMPLYENTLGFIYIVRNPADVMLSNFYYSLRSSNNTDKTMCVDLRTSFVDDYIANRGNSTWIKLGFGSWDEHVLSWLTTTRFPKLVIKYEDMLKDPIHHAERLNSFLNLNKTEAEVKEAVANSSFERMKSVENADIKEKKVGIFYAPHLKKGIDSGIRFVRGGTAGKGFEELSDIQRQNFLRAFYPIMIRLGYSKDEEAYE